MLNEFLRMRAHLSSPVLRAGLLAASALSAVTLFPVTAKACACGCGIFDVGFGVLSSMPNSDTGVSVWFRYDYMNQNQNWEHGSKAPALDNADKWLNTSFYTVGGEYQVNPNWTVMAELPTYARQLETTDDGTVAGPPGSIYTGHLTSLGDLQLAATYSGFSADQSSGIMFGVKLPTGDDRGPKGRLGGAEFDRDSLPGTGSTDLMIGGYHTGSFDPTSHLSYFIQGKYQAAVMTSDGYRPGNEIDAAAGLSYDLGQQGPLNDVSPVLQVIDSWRLHDTGANADPLNSGYERLLVSPGVAVQMNKFRVFADVELPIYQTFNAASFAATGNSGQLAASALYKVQVAYDF